MAKTISRTIITTKINILKEDGTEKTIDYIGDIGAAKAAKLIKKERPELGNFTIKNVSAVSQEYEVDIEDFLTYARIKKDKTDNEEKNSAE